MIAAVDPLFAVIGSLSGFAAVIVAVNTVLLRRDANRQKAKEAAASVVAADGLKRMDTFELSQKSLTSALARADEENMRLRKELEDQAKHITECNNKIFSLQVEVDALIDELRELKRER